MSRSRYRFDVRDDFYDDYFQLEDRHWWFVGRRRILLRMLDRYVGPGAAGEVLDFGCGPGGMLRHLGRYGRAQGVDADEQAVELGRRRGAGTVTLLTSPRLPFDDGSFGLVTALDVLEHLDDDHGALAEIRRVLRPGGALLVTVPAYRSLWGLQDEVSHHRRRYVAGELRERLRSSGFEIRRLSYFNSILFPPIAAVRIARRLRRAPPAFKSDLHMHSADSVLNGMLARLFGLEAGVVERVDVPFGVSIVALAHRPPGERALPRGWEGTPSADRPT